MKTRTMRPGIWVSTLLAAFCTLWLAGCGGGSAGASGSGQSAAVSSGSDSSAATATTATPVATDSGVSSQEKADADNAAAAANSTAEVNALAAEWGDAFYNVAGKQGKTPAQLGADQLEQILQDRFGTGVSVEMTSLNPPTYDVSFDSVTLGARGAQVDGTVTLTLQGSSVQVTMTDLQIGDALIAGTVTITAGETTNSLLISDTLTITLQTQKGTLTVSVSDAALTMNNETRVVAFSGSMTVTTADRTVDVVIEEMQKGPNDAYPSGHISLTSGDKTLQVTFDGSNKAVLTYDGKDYEVTLPDSLHGLTLGRHRGGVYAVAFSTDGQRLVSGGADMTIKVWNFPLRKITTRKREHQAAVTALAWGPQDGFLASADFDGTINLWDTSNWTVASTSTCDEQVNALAFLVKNGDTFLVGALQDGTVRFWRVLPGGTRLVQVQSVTANSGPTRGLALSADGTRMVSGGTDAVVKLWDITSAPETVTGLSTMHSAQGGAVNGVGLLNDGAIVVADDNTVLSLYDATGTFLSTAKKPESPIILGFDSLAVSPDGVTVATGGDDTYPITWWERIDRNISYEGSAEVNGDDTVALAFSRDALYLVSGSVDGTLKVLKSH